MDDSVGKLLCLLYECEDLGSITQNPLKTGCICNSSTVTWEAAVLPKNSLLACQLEKSSSKQTHTISKQEEGKD